MVNESEINSQVFKLLATGVRRRWWCIGPSAMFGNKPVGLTRLGEKLVDQLVDVVVADGNKLAGGAPGPRRRGQLG